MRYLSVKTLAILSLLFTNLFWASNAVVARYAATEIPPFTLAFGRWLMALLFILPFAWPHLRGNFAHIKERWRVILVLALLGVVFFNNAFYLVGHLTSAINITMVNACLPLVTLLFSWLLLKVVPSQWQLLGIIVSLAGVLIIITSGDISVFQQLSFNYGDVLMFINICTWSVYSVLLGKYPPKLHPLASLTVLMIVGLPFLAGFAALEIALLPPFELTAANMTLLAYVAIFPSIIAYILWGYGIKVLGPNIAALSCYLMPLLAALLAIPLLGERLYSYHFSGGFMILLGLFFAFKKMKKA